VNNGMRCNGSFFPFPLLCVVWLYYAALVHVGGGVVLSICVVVLCYRYVCYVVSY
jgi:hypothetical protein